MIPFALSRVVTSQLNLSTNNGRACKAPFRGPHSEGPCGARLPLTLGRGHSGVPSGEGLGLLAAPWRGKGPDRPTQPASLPRRDCTPGR